MECFCPKTSDKYSDKDIDNKNDDKKDDKEDDDFEDTDTNAMDDYDPHNPSDKHYSQDALGSSLKYYTKIFLPPRSDLHRPQRPVVPGSKMWTDPDFPRPMKIKVNKKMCLLEWKRPHKIFRNPVLFHEETERGDINQRSFGTCWFLAMVANVADNPVLRRKVINEMSYTPRTDGIFHCRMWRFGEWVDVYTDDLLPVRRKSVFLFGAAAPSLSGELWVSLLEKALARLHGSYSVVEGGWPSDAYLSLTGGVAETIDFANYSDHPHHLFRRIANALGSGGMVTCCNLADEDNMGLLGAHAYSLTGAKVVMRHDGEEIPLVRIRNPHGEHSEEWQGKWSDRSDEWSTLQIGSNLHHDNEDGEFWIDVDDFIRYFHQTTICSLTPDFDIDGRSDPLNYVLKIFGQWQGGTSVGQGYDITERLGNPKMAYTLPGQGGDVPVVVHIVQNADRGDRIYHMRCDLFKVINGAETASHIFLEKMPCNTERKDYYYPARQYTFRYSLTPGRYIVLPSLVHPGVNREFLIRVFSPRPLYKCRSIPRQVQVVLPHHRR
ncbi:calpain-2 catalytic subunit-like [Haliotis rufescens]|uniref:calpain-2 catalytic subunit-like n=1 Tax=Haliotis rufescens TaxID=6454 RepID=UPI00201FAEA2|nr:calpain-2 catalytic subunit-like [Haliotis rufescens]